MARVIKRIDRTPVRYPWWRWADGRNWRARMGTDFHCSLAGFRSTLYRRAYRSKQKVIVSVKEDIVEFQFFKLPGLPDKESPR